MKITDEKELRKIANDVRIDIINEVYSAKSGHPGGALSIADILTVLYFNQMNVNPEMPQSNLRDRLVLSRGMHQQLYMRCLQKEDLLIKKI